MVKFNAPLYSCKECATPIALRDDLVSKDFRGKWGRGYMISKMMNIVVGEGEERKFLTGIYKAAPIYCGGCNEECGWKYLEANEPKQKFKEGKFVIERSKIVKED